jgi:hypothetical protein
MITRSVGYKIKRVTFKPSRWLREIILNSNGVPQAKKKLIVLRNWNLGLFCHRRHLKIKYFSGKWLPQANKSLFYV